MTALVAILSTTLIAIALLHLMWAIGLWWPIREETALARAVLGTPDVTRMPGVIPCALVAVALVFAAIVPFDRDLPARGVVMPLSAAVFLLRGIAAYVPSWRKRVPTEPFATLDVRYFAPLCLVIGAAFLVLIIGEF